MTPTGLLSTSQRDMSLGKLMLVVTEIAEAAEAVRHDDRLLFKEEIADAFIRLMDIVGAMNLKIGKEICRKAHVNMKRPIRHGKCCSL